MNKLLTFSVEELIEIDYLSEMKRNNLRKVIFINRRQKEMPSIKDLYTISSQWENIMIMKWAWLLRAKYKAEYIGTLGTNQI